MGRRTKRERVQVAVELTSLDHIVLQVVGRGGVYGSGNDHQTRRVLERLVQAHAVQRFVRHGVLTFEITNTGRALLQ